MHPQRADYAPAAHGQRSVPINLALQHQRPQHPRRIVSHVERIFEQDSFQVLRLPDMEPRHSDSVEDFDNFQRGNLSYEYWIGEERSLLQPL